MNKYQKQVLDVLKPKVKALGFSKKDVESIAADIADNLSLEDEASEDDVNAEIEKQVDAVIPSLKIAQKAINRGIQKFMESQESEKEEDEEKEETPAPVQTSEEKKEDTPAWATDLMSTIQSLKEEVSTMKSAKVADTRREKLTAMLKDTGTFGKRVLKNFDRMKFETEEEFEDFVSDVQDDLESLNQERANEGLGKLGAPASGNKQKPEETKLLTDAELDELANTF